MVTALFTKIQNIRHLVQKWIQHANTPYVYKLRFLYFCVAHLLLPAIGLTCCTNILKALVGSLPAVAE